MALKCLNGACTKAQGPGGRHGELEVVGEPRSGDWVDGCSVASGA